MLPRDVVKSPEVSRPFLVSLPLFVESGLCLGRQIDHASRIRTTLALVWVMTLGTVMDRFVLAPYHVNRSSLVGSRSCRGDPASGIATSPFHPCIASSCGARRCRGASSRDHARPERREWEVGHCRNTNSPHQNNLSHRLEPGPERRTAHRANDMRYSRYHYNSGISVSCCPRIAARLRVSIALAVFSNPRRFQITFCRSPRFLVFGDRRR